MLSSLSFSQCCSSARASKSASRSRPQRRRLHRDPHQCWRLLAQASVRANITNTAIMAATTTAFSKGMPRLPGSHAILMPPVKTRRPRRTLICVNQQCAKRHLRRHDHSPRG